MKQFCNLLFAYTASAWTNLYIEIQFLIKPYLVLNTSEVMYTIILKTQGVYMMQKTQTICIELRGRSEVELSKS